MYYIMLRFPFLYVGLGRTTKYFFKLVGEKKLVGIKPGKTREFQIAWPIDTQITLHIYLCDCANIHFSNSKKKKQSRNLFKSKKLLFHHIALHKFVWFQVIFYILIMDEKVLVLCEKWLSIFSSNLYVLRPPES